MSETFRTHRGRAVCKPGGCCILRLWRRAARVRRTANEGEGVMRHWLVGILMLAGAPALAQQTAVPVIPFDSVPNPLRMPTDLYLGEVSGIAVNAKKHIFVFTRGNT